MSSIADDPLYQESFVESPDGRRFSIERYNQLAAARQAKNPVKRPLHENAVRREVWDAWPQREKDAHIASGGWVQD
jgi:hypothetical protein